MSQPDRNYRWLLRHMKGESIRDIALADDVARASVYIALGPLGVSRNGRLNTRWINNGAPSSAKKPYLSQKYKATVRGIPWCFDFETWWRVWGGSGKWALRGRKSHQYCMARTGDTGPYAEGNVRICTIAENLRERNEVLRARRNPECAPGFTSLAGFAGASAPAFSSQHLDPSLL